MEKEFLLLLAVICGVGLFSLGCTTAAPNKEFHVVKQWNEGPKTFQAIEIRSDGSWKFTQQSVYYTKDAEDQKEKIEVQEGVLSKQQLERIIRLVNSGDFFSYEQEFHKPGSNYNPYEVTTLSISGSEMAVDRMPSRSTELEVAIRSIRQEVVR